MHIAIYDKSDDEKRPANPARKLPSMCVYTHLYTLNALMPQAITYPPSQTAAASCCD